MHKHGQTDADNNLSLGRKYMEQQWLIETDIRVVDQEDKSQQAHELSRQGDPVAEQPEEHEDEPDAIPSDFKAEKATANHETNCFQALEARIGPIPHVRFDLIGILRLAEYDMDLAEAIFYQSRAAWLNGENNLDQIDPGNTVKHSAKQLKPGEPRGRAPMEDQNDVLSVAQPQSTPGIEHASLQDSDHRRPNYSAMLGPTWLGDYNMEEILTTSGKSWTLATDWNTADLTINSDLDTERRSAVCIFAKVVHDELKLRLNPAEAAVALAFADWNFDRGFNRYKQYPDEFRVVLSRVLQGYRKLREPQDDGTWAYDNSALKTNRRLALFMTLTGAMDVASARNHFDHHQQDLFEALEEWVNNGIMPITAGSMAERISPKQGGTQKDGSVPSIASPTEKTHDSHTPYNKGPHWSDFMDLFGLEGFDVDMHSWYQKCSGTLKYLLAENNQKTNQAMLDIRLINPNIDNAKPGVPDWSKFQLEIMDAGVYSTRLSPQYQQLKLHQDSITQYSQVEDRPTVQNADVFDWNDEDDVKGLNTWRHTEIHRITGIQLHHTKDDTTKQKLSLTERRFLWDVWDLLWRQHNSHPENDDKTEEEIRKSFS